MTPRSCYPLLRLLLAFALSVALLLAPVDTARAQARADAQAGDNESAPQETVHLFDREFDLVRDGEGAVINLRLRPAAQPQMIETLNKLYSRVSIRFKDDSLVDAAEKLSKQTGLLLVPPVETQEILDEAGPGRTVNLNFTNERVSDILTRLAAWASAESRRRIDWGVNDKGVVHMGANVDAHPSPLRTSAYDITPVVKKLYDTDEIELIHKLEIADLIKKNVGPPSIWLDHFDWLELATSPGDRSRNPASIDHFDNYLMIRANDDRHRQIAALLEMLCIQQSPQQPVNVSRLNLDKEYAARDEAHARTLEALNRSVTIRNEKITYSDVLSSVIRQTGIRVHNALRKFNREPGPVDIDVKDYPAVEVLNLLADPPARHFVGDFREYAWAIDSRGIVHIESPENIFTAVAETRYYNVSDLLTPWPQGLLAPDATKAQRKVAALRIANESLTAVLPRPQLAIVDQPGGPRCELVHHLVIVHLPVDKHALMRNWLEAERTQLRAKLDKQLALRIYKPVTFEFVSLPLKDAIEDIALQTGAQITPNWRQLEAAGITPTTEVTFKLENVSAALALDLMLQHLGDNVGCTIRENVAVLGHVDDD